MSSVGADRSSASDTRHNDGFGRSDCVLGHEINFQKHEHVVIYSIIMKRSHAMRTKPPHSALSPEALQLVAERFRVLAEPLRLRILQLLRSGEKNVTELTTQLATTQPNASKHLR